MEESGHYYTVYFTSLAVGFKEEIAYRHAVLAQLPDEVGWLDAANMHINQCSRSKEYDLNGNKRRVDYRWRYDIEYAIHSLPDKINGNSSSSFQRSATQKMLSEEDPLSLKFGLLLHRLGDTFAHSMISNETKMYTVSATGDYTQCIPLDSLGHARDGHDPDFPFLRPTLYDKYLTELYNVLNQKARQPRYADYVRKTRPLLLEEIRIIFKKILTDEHGIVSASMRAGLIKPTTQIFFIQQIREHAIRNLGITMKPYAPERIEKQTLTQFLSEHHELDSLAINEQKMNEAVTSIKKDLGNKLQNNKK